METSRSHSPLPPDADTMLYRFGAGRVVLLGYREGDEWILARGWRTRDRFSDIRRWRFTVAEHFAAQAFRLIRDEGLNDSSAKDAEAAAVDWVVAISS
ncbi:hypothetical protein BH09CHL1_BH09CHL1_07300 [soil metagenome]